MTISPLLHQVHSYVDGDWHETPGIDFSDVRNPATGELLCRVPQLSDDAVGLAIESAARALQQPTSAEQRTIWLQGIADLMDRQKSELGRIITLEHGKPLAEAIVEVEYAASFFRYYAGVVERLEPRVLSSTPRHHRWTLHSRPAGVAALITPWNFPLAMAAKKLSAAMAADCSCLCKPSSKTPLTMIAFFSLLHALKLPPGKANLLLGSSAEISALFCKHPAVRVISFTGSTAVGQELMGQAATHLKRLSLELGGNAPFIVFDDASIDSAVAALMQNKFRASGQTCVCTNRVYVHRQIAVDFTEELTRRVSQLKMGNGLNRGVQIGPLINKDALDKVEAIFDDAIRLGARILTGGPLKSDGGPKSPGHFFPPTVLDDVTPQMRCVKEETFGPLIPILEFETEAEVLHEANRTEYGLAAYLFTHDQDRAERMFRQLTFGHVGWNTGMGPTAEAPFGGFKQSGFGREGGEEGLHEYLEIQTVPTPVPMPEQQLVQN